MSDGSRFLLRLRQRALRSYEWLLYALLLALLFAVGLVSSTAAEEAQCGNIQSSPEVMTR